MGIKGGRPVSMIEKKQSGLDEYLDPRVMGQKLMTHERRSSIGCITLISGILRASERAQVARGYVPTIG